MEQKNEMGSYYACNPAKLFILAKQYELDVFPSKLDYYDFIDHVAIW